MTQPWYPISAMRRANVPIRVRWAWFEGTAVLLREKPGAALRWVTPRADGTRGLDPLPPRWAVTWRDTHVGERIVVDDRRADTIAQVWGSRPDGWQPLDPATWPDALPEPLPVQPHHEGRYTTIGGVAYDAVADAAEMEEAREAARCRRDDAPAAEPLPWWRDGTLVTYSPPGAITPREAEGRVMRALYFLTGPERIAAYRTNAAVMADLMAARDWGQSDFSSPHVPRLQVTAADTPDRLLAAMRWVCELRYRRYGEDQFYVLCGRARNEPATFEDIGDQIYLSKMRKYKARHLQKENLARNWFKAANKESITKRFFYSENSEISLNGFVGKPPTKSSRDSIRRSYTTAIASLVTIANAGTPTADAHLATIQQGNRAYANAR